MLISYIPYGFITGSLVPLITNGPFSKKIANSLEQPGPPVSQTTKGFVDGLFRLSKNQ